jgi:hypothetical protein
MGAAAVPVVGAIITGVVVSKAVSSLAPKLGFGESASQMLGMAAGMYAGGMVGGGSTQAVTDTATATTSQVGTQLPTGYGGPTNPTGSGFAGTGPGAGGAAAGASGGGAMSAAQLGKAMPSLQAPTTGAAPQGAVASPVDTPVLDSGTPMTESVAGQPPQAGMLKQAAEQPISRTAIQQRATTQAGQMGGDSVSKSVIQSQGKTAPAENDWWGKLFTPEKTMDLIMAGMQGYGQAAMAEEEREYPEKIARQNEKEWSRAYGGGGLLSLSQNYPSQ